MWIHLVRIWSQNFLHSNHDSYNLSQFDRYDINQINKFMITALSSSTGAFAAKTMESTYGYS